MNHDTPLDEVARHLPRNAAAQLLEQPPEVQTVVLKHTRSILVSWESQEHVRLDPIVSEILLNGLVPSLVPVYTELLQLWHANAVLHATLEGAVDVRNLGAEGALGGERWEQMDAHRPPHEQVAQLFMERKGLGDLEPLTQEKVTGTPCWYFTYEVDENRLELEVAWTVDDEASDDDGTWEAMVTSFVPLTD